jgi:hypothetical protein
MPDYLKRARQVEGWMDAQDEIRTANRVIKRWLSDYLDEKGVEHDMNPRRILNMGGHQDDYRQFTVKMRGIQQRMFEEVVVPELRSKAKELLFRFKSFWKPSWLFPGQCDAQVTMQYDGDWRFGSGEVK